MAHSPNSPTDWPQNTVFPLVVSILKPRCLTPKKFNAKVCLQTNKTAQHRLTIISGYGLKDNTLSGGKILLKKWGEPTHWESDTKVQGGGGKWDTTHGHNTHHWVFGV